MMQIKINNADCIFCMIQLCIIHVHPKRHKAEYHIYHAYVSYRKYTVCNIYLDLQHLHIKSHVLLFLLLLSSSLIDFSRHKIQEI